MQFLLNPRLAVEMWPVAALFIRITLEDAYQNSLNWVLFIIIIVLVLLMTCMLTILLVVIRVYMFTVSFILQPDSGILRSCGSSIESTSHFLLHCPLFHGKRHTLRNTLNNIDSKLLEYNDSYLTQTLLFGSTLFDSETKTLVLNATINYILSTEKVEEPPFFKKLCFFICNLFNPFRSTFFCIPRHLKFSVPGDCDFLVYCVILYVNIFIYKKRISRKDIFLQNLIWNIASIEIIGTFHFLALFNQFP